MYIMELLVYRLYYNVLEKHSLSRCTMKNCVCVSVCVCVCVCLRRHLLCLLKWRRRLSPTIVWSGRSTPAQPASSSPGGRRHKGFVVQGLKLIEGFTVADKCALRVTVCAVMFIKTFLLGLGRRRERGALHNGVHAFHVKCAFKKRDSPLSSSKRIVNQRTRTRVKSIWQLHFVERTRIQDGVVLPAAGWLLRLRCVLPGLLPAGGGWVSVWVCVCARARFYAGFQPNTMLTRDRTCSHRGSGSSLREERMCSSTLTHPRRVDVFAQTEKNTAMFENTMMWCVWFGNATVPHVTPPLISIHVFFFFLIVLVFLLLFAKRSAGLLPERGDHRCFPQSPGAEDPQQFPRVQLGHGWHGHLHERHHRRFLQLPEVSDATGRCFHEGNIKVWSGRIRFCEGIITSGYTRAGGEYSNLWSHM